MSSEKQERYADAARKLYAEKFRHELEPEHNNQFVAIEPVSGEYFLGQTLSDAIGTSRAKYPDRLTHAMRVGHTATIHLGTLIQ